MTNLCLLYKKTRREFLPSFFQFDGIRSNSTTETVGVVMGQRSVSNKRDCSKNEYWSDGLCCDKCAPGYKLKKKCSSGMQSECEKCSNGTFQDSMNYFPNCFRCQKCNKRKLHVRGTVTMSSTDHVGLTHCKFLLVFAVLMDLFGVSILLIGIFVPLEIGGRDFGDLLVYSGALLVLMSMGAWVMWYSGNIDGLISEKELTDKHNAVERFARSLSRRIRRPHRDHRTS
ncbi:unnamed protein product [Leuciscus chuanchicus]